MNTTATAVEQQTERDPRGIERQNEALRADMDRTLEALERKLSPGQLLDRMLELAKEHGGEAAANLGESVKQNPVPALLSAVGIAWMMSSLGRGPAPRGVESEDSKLGERWDEARARASETAGRMSDRVSAAGARLHGAADSVKSTAHAAAARGRDARATFESMLEEQPLTVGAVGLALGAILGSVLPATRREDRAMGEMRDRALDRVRAEGEDRLERVREGAERTVEAARSGTQEEEEPRQTH